jgi:hypothetical protein
MFGIKWDLEVSTQTHLVLVMCSIENMHNMQCLCTMKCRVQHEPQSTLLRFSATENVLVGC